MLVYIKHSSKFPIS